jgi:hypothetical protein
MAIIERCGRLSRDKANHGSERRTRDGNRTHIELPRDHQCRPKEALDSLSKA